jgi:hypothetical protein
MSTEKSELKPLPKEFRRQGWWYRELQRQGNIRLYLQSSGPDFAKATGYVVAKIRRKKEGRLPRGEISPAQEVFPSAYKFGADGFFYTAKEGRGLERAEAKYKELLANTPAVVDARRNRRPQEMGES